MIFRPEIAGIVGLVVAGFASISVWLRQLPPSTTGKACPRCGTLQPLPSRPAVLARHVFDKDTCVGCGQSLSEGE